MEEVRTIVIEQLHRKGYALIGTDIYFSSYMWPMDENGVVIPLDREPTDDEIVAFTRFLRASYTLELPPLPTQ